MGVTSEARPSEARYGAVREVFTSKQVSAGECKGPQGARRLVFLGMVQQLHDIRALGWFSAILLDFLSWLQDGFCEPIRKSLHSSIQRCEIYVREGVMGMARIMCVCACVRVMGGRETVFLRRRRCLS